MTSPSPMLQPLQSSGIFGTLAILAAVMVAIAGSLIILLSRSRRAHWLALVLGGLPLGIGAAGTVFSYLTSREAIFANSAAPMADGIEQWHMELASPAIVGLGTTLPLVGLLGGLFALRARARQ